MSALTDQHSTWKQANQRLWDSGHVARVAAKHPALTRMRQLLDAFDEPHATDTLSPLFVASKDMSDPADVVLDQIERTPEILDQPPPMVILASWKTIAKEVCEKHQIRLVDLISPRRDPQSVAARHEAFYRCRTETTMSLPQIGRRFGNRDHTTVLYGIRRYMAKMEAAG